MRQGYDEILRHLGRIKAPASYRQKLFPFERIARPTKLGAGPFAASINGGALVARRKFAFVSA